MSRQSHEETERVKGLAAKMKVEPMNDTPLNLCSKHKQEWKQSHFAEINCDYCNLERQLIASNAKLDKWKTLREISQNIEPGEQGDGVECDPTPESVSAHLKYIYDEWENAEKRIGVANARVKELEGKLMESLERGALQGVKIVTLVQNLEQQKINIRTAKADAFEEAAEHCIKSCNHSQTGVEFTGTRMLLANELRAKAAAIRNGREEG